MRVSIVLFRLSYSAGSSFWRSLTWRFNLADPRGQPVAKYDLIWSINFFCALATSRTEFDSRRGHSRISARCRWSAGFLRDLQFSLSLNSCAAPHSPRFALIGSQDYIWLGTDRSVAERQDNGPAVYAADINTFGSYDSACWMIPLPYACAVRQKSIYHFYDTCSSMDIVGKCTFVTLGIIFPCICIRPASSIALHTTETAVTDVCGIADSTARPARACRPPFLGLPHFSMPGRLPSTVHYTKEKLTPLRSVEIKHTTSIIRSIYAASRENPLGDMRTQTALQLLSPWLAPGCSKLPLVLAGTDARQVFSLDFHNPERRPILSKGTLFIKEFRRNGPGPVLRYHPGIPWSDFPGKSNSGWLNREANPDPPRPDFINRQTGHKRLGANVRARKYDEKEKNLMENLNKYCNKRRNARPGETGNPRESSHRQPRFPHAVNRWRPPPGIEHRSPWWEASSLTTTPPWPQEH
ncbi:hypothetical protein PR048_014283 [Dryococelus australis]|uniref:Uncharacterized protein n=1 Tax=Dryococelus australis TaxID=614101 RepID=A0ABQ9HEJ4_9NEOP|nr:hypothetical protein PR048_014283 [Dryococelus australis]